jgi:site-specific DNA recombinase
VVLEGARVGRQIFTWIGPERLSLREVSRRLQQRGIPTRAGKSHGDSSTLLALRRNPASSGEAH